MHTLSMIQITGQKFHLENVSLKSSLFGAINIVKKWREKHMDISWLYGIAFDGNVQQNFGH